MASEEEIKIEIKTEADTSGIEGATAAQESLNEEVGKGGFSGQAAGTAAYQESLEKTTVALEDGTKALKENTAAKKENTNLPDAPDSPEANKGKFKSDRRKGFLNRLRSQRKEMDKTGRSSSRFGKKIANLTGKLKGLSKGVGLVAVLKGLHLGLKGLENGAKKAAKPMRALQADLEETKGSGASAVGALASITEGLGKAAGAAYRFFDVWGEWRSAVKQEADALRAGKKAREDWIEKTAASAKASAAAAKATAKEADEAKKLRQHLQGIIDLKERLADGTEDLEEKTEAENEKMEQQTQAAKDLLREKARLRKAEIDSSGASDAEKEDAKAEVDRMLEDKVAELDRKQRGGESSNNKKLIDDLKHRVAELQKLVERPAMQLDTGAVMSEEEVNSVEAEIESLKDARKVLMGRRQKEAADGNDHTEYFESLRQKIHELTKEIEGKRSQVDRSGEILENNGVKTPDELRDKIHGNDREVRALKKRIRDIERANQKIARAQGADNAVRKTDRKADFEEERGRKNTRKKNETQRRQKTEGSQADELLGDLAKEAGKAGHADGAALAEQIRTAFKDGKITAEEFKKVGPLLQQFFAANGAGINGLVGVTQEGLQQMKGLQSQINILREQVKTRTRTRR